MIEVTEEARAERDVINDALAGVTDFTRVRLSVDCENAIMLALDKHHGRTPPDPMVAKARRIYAAAKDYPTEASAITSLAAALKKEFPDG